MLNTPQTALHSHCRNGCDLILVLYAPVGDYEFDLLLAYEASSVLGKVILVYQLPS